MGVSVITIIMAVTGVVWLSLSIVPQSLAQDNPVAALGLPECWTKMVNCMVTSGIDLQDPNSNFGICCPVIKPQVANNATCFCSIKEYAENIPNDQPAVTASQVELSSNKLLADCKIDTTYDQLCSSTNNKAAGSLPGTAKNGAIKIAPMASLFVLMMNVLIIRAHI